MGFCVPEQTGRFLQLVPGTEKAMTDSVTLLLKYWLEVSADEQTRRLPSRIHDPRKIWKLSPIDLKSYKGGRHRGSQLTGPILTAGPCVARGAAMSPAVARACRQRQPNPDPLAPLPSTPAAAGASEGPAAM
jgi:hypothetical protein